MVSVVFSLVAPQDLDTMKSSTSEPGLTCNFDPRLANRRLESLTGNLYLVVISIEWVLIKLRGNLFSFNHLSSFPR